MATHKWGSVEELAGYPATKLRSRAVLFTFVLKSRYNSLLDLHGSNLKEIPSEDRCVRERDDVSRVEA
jgi:hypothetical protein